MRTFTRTLNTRLAALALAGAVSAACSDALPTGPSTRPLSAAVQQRAVADAANASASQTIVLHGSQGRVYRYMLRGTELIGPSGRAIRLTRANVALLRRMAAIDATVERLAAAARPIWRARGLREIDAVEPRHVARPVRIPVFTESMLRAPTSVASMMRSGGDVCTDLYLDLYEDTRIWHEASDALDGAMMSAANACLGNDRNLITCIWSIEESGFRMAEVLFWETVLNEVAWELDFRGCTN